MVLILHQVSGVPAAFYQANLNPPVLACGAALFVAGQAINLYHHVLLSRLRKAQDRSYVLPSGGLFDLVVCPHYLGEIMAWWGVALIAGQLNAFLLAASFTSYLSGRAVATRSWYKTKLDMPGDVKSIFPYVL